MNPLLERKLRWPSLARQIPPDADRVLVLATFTAEPLVPFLGTALHDRGRPAAIAVGPYDQIVQSCLAPIATDDARPTSLLVWPRLEELAPRVVGAPLADLWTAHLLEVVDAATGAAEAWGSELVFVLPAVPERRPSGIFDAARSDGVPASAELARSRARQRLADLGCLRVVDAEDTVRSLGSAATYDDRLAIIARAPFRQAALADVADRTAALLAPGARGAVVLDVEALVLVDANGKPYLDEARRRFLDDLFDAAESGATLAFAFAGTPAALHERLAVRELASLSAFARVAAPTLPDAVAQIAEARRLPVERLRFVGRAAAADAVQKAHRSVSVVALPDDASEWPRRVRGAGALDAPSGLRASAPRSISASSCPAPSTDFLRALDLEVYVERVEPRDRAACLAFVERSQRFVNRPVDADVRACLSEGASMDVRRYRWRDSSGDRGVVGVTGLRTTDAEATLHLFAMSWAAWGTGVEEAMLADLLEHLSAHDVRALTIDLRPTARNRPALEFFARHGFSPLQQRQPRPHVSWPDTLRRGPRVTP